MSFLDRDAFSRGLWPEGLVAALATLAVAWPLTELLREETWVAPAVLLVALVAITGAVLRTLDVPPSWVSIGQLAVGLGGLTLTFLRDTLWRGVVPTGETVERAGELLRQAGTVLQTYAAPAPTTAGVTFLVVAVITLTAVSVDSMGVTGRAPASAGIPLAAAFLVSVSNNGEAMRPWYFVAVAAAWLVMLAQQGHRLVGAWPSSPRQESRGDLDVSARRPHHGGLAQVLGTLALAGAVLGAAAIPHLPPTFFGEGLARNPDANQVGGEAGQVSFTETMDPSRDLRNQSTAPVLTYRTDAISLEPLRVTSTEVWEDGRWVAPERDPSVLVTAAGGQLPPPDGLSTQIETTEQTFRVEGNALDPPHLATPTLTVAVDARSPWRYDPTDSTVLLQGPSTAYTTTYLAHARGAELPEGTGDTPADPADFPRSVLALDPASEEAVAALTDQVVGETENDLQAAILLQDHLRSGRYRYSLELAPSAQADAADPIGGFLATRQGYCVQFATAMVMMARHEGIPARMAVGFLPGEPQPDGTRDVIASDAHTWPELWISGMGWTRFEPTPGIRTPEPPAYARSESSTDAAPSTRTVTRTVEPTPTAAPAPAPERTLADDLADLLPTLGRTLAVVLVLALLMAMVPVMGRRYREAEVRRAASAREKVEGQWLLLTRSLGDLGVDAPPARSPKDMARHYRTGSVLGTRGEEALGRVTATLERSRYAPPSAVHEEDAASMGRDVGTVVASVRRQSPWNLRANAALLPRSGFEGIRDGLRRLVRR